MVQNDKDHCEDRLMRKDYSDQDTVELPAASFIKQNKVVHFGKFVVQSSYQERSILEF